MSFGKIARCVTGAVLLLTPASLAAPAAFAQSLRGNEPSYLDFGIGAFNAIDTHGQPTAAEGRIEFRYGEKLFFVGPAVGLLANTKGGVFGYGGVYSNIAFGRFILTPLAGLGGYHRGGSENLGGTFEFRLSLEGAYELDDKSRLGIQIGHISNAGIHDRNPGENEILATYALPLSSLF
jgi:lipid A 3-O-deacylase